MIQTSGMQSQSSQPTAKSVSISSTSSSTSSNLTTSHNENTITIYDLLPILEPYQAKATMTPKESSTVVYQLIEKLMEYNCDKQSLQYMSRYFSIQSYSELETERIINHYCGYPLCHYYNDKKIKEINVNQLVNKLRLPSSYNSRFCCKRHYQCSQFYKKQLSPEALFSRSNLNLPFNHPKSFEKSIILLDDVFEIRDSNQVVEIIDLLKEMKVDDPSLETDELIDKFTSIRIVENNGFMKSDDVYGETNDNNDINCI